jgi:hypothetical protein
MKLIAIFILSKVSISVNESGYLSSASIRQFVNVIINMIKLKPGRCNIRKLKK